MGVQLFANNASSQLSGSLPQGGTTLVCSTGQGARFPSPSNGDFFYVTLYTKDAYAVEQNIEIVKVTSRATDVMTIVRDIEGITGNAGGFAYAGGSDTTYIDMRWTAGCVDNMAQKGELAAVATTGSYADLIGEPTAFSPSIITQDASNRFVTDVEKAAWNAKEATVAAGTTAQYYRGDKSFQTLDKAAVGLGNVTNTADADKPVSTAQQTALDLKLDKTGGTITTNSANPALKVTQSGTGNAFVVEDVASDTTPFIINADGRVAIGASTGITGVSLTVGGDSTTSSIDCFAPIASAAGFSQRFFKSRNANIYVQTIVQNGDTLGASQYFGSDGTTHVHAASITSQVDGTPGTNDMPGRLVFSTTPDGASTPVERMRIDSAGNVGIGCSPSYGLDVSSTIRAATGFSLTTDGSYYVPSGAATIPNYGIGSPYVNWVGLSGFSGLAFYTNQVERMRIGSDGTVVIPNLSSNTLIKSESSTEGGQIQFEKPASGTSLLGNVVVDVIGDTFRILENGGTFRGVSLGLAGCAAGSVTQLVGHDLTQTLTNKTLTGYTETQYNLTGTDLAVSNGTVQYKTLSGNTTFTESLADGQGVILMLNPSTFAPTWPTTTWIGTVASAAPTLVASVYNCIVFFQMNGTLYGRYVGRV